MGHGLGNFFHTSANDHLHCEGGGNNNGINNVVYSIHTTNNALECLLCQLLQRLKSRTKYYITIQIQKINTHKIKIN